LRIINENIIELKIQIENLKAKMTGRELNIYQKSDALIEFNKLLDYVNELEQLTIPVVVSTLPNECGLLKNINGCDKGSGCRYPNCV
jgi:hypothetical protein